MNSKVFSYNASEKLKSRKLLNRIFAEGKSINAYPLKVLYLIAETSTKQNLCGVGVSSKHFKKAVERNRIKRLLRESYRLQKKVLAEAVSENQQLIVFFLFTGKDLAESALIPEKVLLLMQKIVQAIQNKNANWSLQ